MRTSAVRTTRGRSGRRLAIFAGRGLAAALLLGSVPAAAQVAGTVPDSLRLENRAYLSYRSGDAGAVESSTAVATVLMERSAGVVVTPSYDVVMAPGERRVLAHRVESQEAAADHFRVDVAGPAGWRVAVYRDLDGDGVLGPGDLLVSAPIDLRSGEGAALLVVVDVPDDYTGAGGAVELRATSTSNNTISGSVTDRVTVRRAQVAATLAKTVDRTEAAAGDTLRYTLVLTNRGDGALPGAVVRDPLPSGVRYLAGSLRLNGAALTDGDDSDAGTIERTPGGETVRVQAGTLAAGGRATATFGVVVQAGAPEGALTNVASLSYAGLASEIVSTPAETRVSQGRLELTKERLGSDTVRSGGQVAYRLGYANRSAVGIRDLVLVDTLPAGLVYVSADGSPEVSGQVLTWRLGTVAPGASGSIQVVARAVLAAGTRATIVNRVVAQGLGAVAATARSAPLEVLPLSGNELEIRKQAGALEGGVGEAVPYTVTVHNRGSVPLGGIVVHDRLPDGMRLVTDGVVGADSVRVDGQEARFFVAGPVAPGADHTLRYAATLLAPGDGAALGNRAWAEAEGGRVRTDTTTAWVRMRRGFAMQERTLIGKVWLDENGDGVQQPGEKGVAGASVWSAAGEVVTTDREGRFSFRNLRPGTQLVRLDTVGLPAGYAVPRAGEDMAQVRMDGWTTPRASFRLVRRLPSTAWEQVRGPGKGAAGPTPAGDGDRGGETSVEARARRLPPRVAPLRTEEEREAEKRSSLVEGPEVRIFAPSDGTVIGTNRLFVGVRGEPGAKVRLYDGEKLLREATLRPDGVWDFIGLDVAPGPHHLRVGMVNSWQKERWDSVAVHRSGEPASFELSARSMTLRAESPAAERLRVRVLDAWKVPVADSPSVTVTVRGASVTTPDVDPSSVGMQVRTELDGWAEVALKGGREVGPGEMVLSYRKVTGRLPLRVLPVVRPLIATGIGQVGVGAAPGAFGAVTVKGAIGSETSVSVNYDSRRSDPDNDFFAGGYDPLEESRYPTLGDRSQGRNLGSATQVLSARVERGFDWLEFGDVQTTGFGGGDRLGTYNRALTGMSGRVTTGALVWHGFGSMTDQSLDQRQIRGDGSSGPYRVGGAIRPGTERVAIEVRARENAARVVARQELARFVDYQVDYETGYILLQRAVPATDPQGNPVFVVATVERRSGGPSRFVGGVRMELDASQLLQVRGVDSLGVGVFGIRDAAAQNFGAGGVPGITVGYDLFGGDLRVRRKGLEAGVEMLRSVRPDSTATAGQAQLSWTLPGDWARMEAGWLRVGEGFSAAANPRLASGLDELRLVGEAKLPNGSRLQLRHERQSFHQYGVERNTTFLTAEQSMAGHKLTAEGGVANDLQSGLAGTSSSTAMGKATLSLSPRVDVWVEGTQLLSSEGTQPTRPDQLGVGVGYKVLSGTTLEGSHRWVRVGGDSTAYALTSFNLRTSTFFGSEMWGGVEHADLENAANSAVLGWNQRLSLVGGWSLNAMAERRFGLNRAPLLDPLRALPFAQPEMDRWSGAVGVEWLPTDSTGRFSARGEMHDGRERSGFRFDIAGDLPLGPSVSLLTRHDWSQDSWASVGNGRENVRDRSLVGFAFRPVDSDGLNALAKLEWRRSANPLLGTEGLAQARDETRLIGSADAVWSPSERTELAWRYAVRWSMSEDSSTFAARSLAHYAGMQAERALRGRLSARLDSRVLLEGVSGSVRWSAAPALVYLLNPQLALEGGYRLGDLRDPDFFTSGGSGFYATLAMRFSEQMLNSAAAFWRQRVAQEF